MDNLKIDKITSRHVARCLADLGVSISPSQSRTVKRWFWLMSDDIKQGNQGELINERQDIN